MVIFVCTIIKFRISITNGNHEAMHTTKQSLPTNDHAKMLSLLTHFDFDSVSSHVIWVIFNIAKLYPFFLLSYLNSDDFSPWHDKHLRIIDYFVTRSISQYSCYLYILVILILFDAIASPRFVEKPKPNSPSNYEILQFRLWAPLKVILTLIKVFLMSHLPIWYTRSSM